MKNCVRRCFHSSTEQPAPVCPRSHQDWNPPEGIRMSDAFPSRTAFLLFLFFYFLSPPPKQLLSSERSLVMKRQHIETTLTLIWRHDSALLEDFSVFWTTFFSHLCRQSALTSVFWLTLFPFPRLTVCLCTVRRLCKHIEPLPLCALHLIFIWSMKADGMPSSQTPCVKPVVSLLKICSVGRPDLTQSHIANRRCKSLIRLFSPPCRSVFYSSSLLFSFKKERRPYSRLHSIWAGVPTSILAEFNYAFPPFFFSRSRSPKALKLLLSLFHNNVPDIINLSQCSFRTVLCVCDRAGGRGQEGRTDISDINHRLVHHSACPQTRRFTAAAPRVVGVYNLCLLLFYLLCALSIWGTLLLAGFLIWSRGS